MQKQKSEIRNKNYEFPKGGFSFVEIMTTLGLFFLLASVGLGAYFQYYKFSLISNDIHNAESLIYYTRTKALKNPSGANYGLHINTATNELTSFEGTFVEGNSSNSKLALEQLTITDLDILPNIGTTHEILFEAVTAKTENTGSFALGNTDFSYIFTINAQGGIGQAQN